MKILDLFEERQPARYVAGRDFNLIRNSEYKGYVLGAEDDGDEDTRKATYAVYKLANANGLDQFSRSPSNEYIRIHSLLDPKTGETHSPYVRSKDVAQMFRYTVDLLTSGKLQPEKVAVATAEGPEGDDIDPQALPGQPIKNNNQPVLKEKFQPNLSTDFEAPSLQDLRYVWTKKSPNDNWMLYKEFNSPDEARAVAKRLRLSTRIETAVGSKTKPVLDPGSRPLGGVYTRGGQTSHEVTPQTSEYQDSAQGAIQFLRSTGKYSTAGAVARKGSRPGIWIVRHRNGETQVDLNHNDVQDLREAVSKKKDFKVTLKEGYEDRVNEVAAKVIELARGEPVDKQTLLHLIDRASSLIGNIEYRMKGHATSKTWKEFVIDVAKSLKGKLGRGRSPEAKAAAAQRQARDNEELKNKLEKIANIIQDAWGQAFPDGDPADIIVPRLRRLGIDRYDAIDWMNKAARRIMGYKSYNDFLATSWEEFKGDNPEMNLGDNPWR